MWGFPKSRGYPKGWMGFSRFILENPMEMDENWGYPHDFRNLHVCSIHVDLHVAHAWSISWVNQLPEIWVARNKVNILGWVNLKTFGYKSQHSRNWAGCIVFQVLRRANTYCWSVVSLWFTNPWAKLLLSTCSLEDNVYIVTIYRHIFIHMYIYIQAYIYIDMYIYIHRQVCIYNMQYIQSYTYI